MREFITYGPEHFKNDKWNLLLMTLNHQGQMIDLSGAYHAKIFNEQTKKWQKLSDLNEQIIYYLHKELGITTALIKSSDYDFKDKKTDFIVELCKEFKADTYFSGPGGKHYMDLELLKKNKLKYIFSDFKHPTYPQRFKPFIENLSAIDLLFNCGPKSLEIIKSSKSNL